MNMKRSRVILATWALALAGGLTACGADGAEPPAATEAPGQTNPVTSPSGESMSVIGGGTFDTAAFDSGPLALWFWAPG